MFFIFRCVFWLSIVYSSMSWVVGAAQPQPSRVLREAVVEGGLALVGAAKDAAVEQAQAWCIETPRQCLADASRLTALVAANQVEDLTEPGGPAPVYPVPPVRSPGARAPRS